MDKNTFFDFEKNRIWKTKRWLSLLCMSLFFVGQTAFTQVLSESFNESSLPAGWTQEYVTGTTDWGVVETNGNGSVTPRTGTHMAEFRIDNSSAKTKLVTPSLDLTSVIDPMLTFYYANVSWFGDIDELRVYYKTSISGSWTQIGDNYTSEKTTWEKVELTLPNPSADYYIAFEGKSNWARGLNLDDVMVGAAPTCLAPIALTATEITATGATLGWTSVGDNFEIEWGAAGFEQGGTDGTVISSINSNSYNITVSEGGNYQFYVRQDCGDGDLSAWAGPFSFRIPLLGEDCAAPIVVGALPYTTTNDTANFTDNPDIEGSPGSSGCGSTSAYLNGNDVVYAYTATFDGVITVDLEHSATYTGIFAYANCDDIGSACIGGAVSGNSTADIGFELPVENGETYYFVISTWATPQTTAYTLEITRLLCPAPSDFSVSDITTDSATLNWLGTSDLYDIEWGETGFEQGSTEATFIEEFNATSLVLDNLDIATTYQYYVRQNCGEVDGVSVWKGPFSFTTACELPDSPENITFTDVTATATKVSFEAPTVAPTGYVVFRSTSDVPPVLTNGITYTTSQTTAIASLTTDDGDTYFCVYNGAGLEGNATSLTSNTEYYYYVFSRNSENSCAGAPWYSTTSLIDSEITAPATPTSAVVSNLTNDSATISWTASAVGGEAGAITYTLEVYTDSAYESPIAGSPFAMGADVSHDLTGLATSTQYYYRIKGNNTYHDSTYLTGSFTTTQIPATLNYEQDFEGTHGWAFVNGTQTNKWYVGNATGNPGNSLYISNDNGTTNAYTNTSTSTVQTYRDIAVPAGVSDASISFDWKGQGEQNASGTTQYDYFRVWMVPASFMPTAGTQIGTGSGRIQIGGNFVNQADWQAYVKNDLDLSSFAGSIMRLVFEWKNDGSGGSGAAAIDNIEITIPDCLKPTGLGLVGLTPESAELSWESQGNSFELKWGIPDFDVDTAGTLIPSSDITGTTYMLEGLTADTHYEFYVRQDCGTDGMSTWAGPYAFKTLCDAVTELPYTENFDVYGTGSDAFPDCWIRPIIYSGYPSIVSAYSVSSPNSLRLQSDVGVPTYAVTPAFTEDVNNLRITFQLKREGESSGTIDVGVMSNPFDSSTFELVATINPTDNNFHEYVVYLNTTTLSGGNHHIAFKHNSSLNNWFYWLDDVMVDEIPTCFPPLNIGVEGVTKNKAEVTWEAPELGNEPEDGYVIEIRTEGAPGEATGLVDTVSGAGLAATLSGLAPDTSYTLYIKTLCTEDDDESIWSEGISFKTKCDYPDYELINTENDLTLCGAGSIALEADSEGIVNWYDAADATEPIFTGTTFETEELTETTSFWVETVGEEGMANVGPANPSAVSTSQDNWTIGWNVLFTVHEPTTLQSVDVFPATIGQTGSIQVREGGTPSSAAQGVLIETINYTTTVGGGSTAQTIPINVELQPGTYNLHPVLPSSGLKRNTSGGSYPYASDVASITANGYSSSYYMGFYNWVFESSCKSPREEVVVTVIPSFDIISAEVEDIFGDSATLQIESEGTVFEVEYGEAGFTPGDGTGTNIPEAGSTYVLEDLESETSYDVYVRASSCAEWFGPVSFTTIIAVNQTITVEDITKVYGDAPFVNGESDSGLALTYTVADESVAVFEDGQIVIVGAGETEVTASQPGNSEYLPAEDVTFTLTVGKASLTISVEDVIKAYDGEVYEAWTIVYDELVYEDDATDLSGELIYSGDAVGAVDIGEYAIEIDGLTSANYDITFVSGNLTITKAELTGITFEDALLVYDGTAKSIAISGELPPGVTVSYTGNGQTEVGDYPVTAHIDGGGNYEDLELEATMSIRGELTGISFEDAEFTYDGTEKSIELIGELPAGVTVTYTGNGQTEVGVYEVTANIDGGSDYMDETLTATLTLTKAALTGITFSDEEFVYDGTAKSLLITGTLPTGVTVAYTGNGQTEAGVYEVVASIDGGNNYEGLELTAELTIVKADLSGVLSLEDTSFVYDGDAKSLAVSGDIPAGVTVSYTGNGQTEAGVYEVTASIDGGTNYEELELTATLTIAKAAISGVTLEDDTFGYDGTSKSLAISGTLPAGASVSYVNNGQTEIGEYEVVASIDGGNNYNDLELTATLTITEGTIPGITFADGYFVYDGTEKSIYITGELPEGSTVSYTNNGQTESGSYVVTATITGNGLYTDLVLSATLTIAKASLETISFEDGTFVYDGTTKSLLVSGALPPSVTVSYQNNGKINVGTYTVIADVDGGVNYVSLHLTAVLTIEKAPQQIDFAELGTVVKEDVGDFQLEATASSGLPVTYSYTYAGLPAAEVSESGWVTLHHSGVIEITAHQEGNQNYLAATPVTRELKIESREASLEEVWIGEAYYDNPDSELYYRMDCGDKSKEVTVRVKATYGASVEPDSEIVIKTPRPGIYKEQLTVRSANGKVEKTYTVIVEKPFGFFEIVEQKFDNTLLVNNNPNTNGGYVFVAYQWYKNGALIGEGQVYSAGDLSTDLLDAGGSYHAVLTTDQGEELYVCPSVIVHKSTHGVQLYPSPVRTGDKVTLQVNYPVSELQGTQVRIYSMKGLLVYSKFLEGTHTIMDLPLTLPSGVYIAVMEIAGKQEVVKFVVE